MSVNAIQSNVPTSLQGLSQLRIHSRSENTAPVDTDTVSTSARTRLSEGQEQSLVTGIQDALPSQKADALSAHGGLDLARAMKLLEGLD